MQTCPLCKELNGNNRDVCLKCGTPLKGKAPPCIITTGHNVEGYKVVKYHGIVYGKTTFSDLFFYQEKPKEEASFNSALLKATQSLLDQAAKKGANAVIGINTQFYNTGTGALGIKLMVCILSGTAVTVISD